MAGVPQLLLSASEDKRLVLHDVRTSAGGTVASFTGHASWVLSVDISQDGRLGLSGCAYICIPFLSSLSF
jgi:WD repeat-containing protein 61